MRVCVCVGGGGGGGGRWADVHGRIVDYWLSASSDSDDHDHLNHKWKKGVGGKAEREGVGGRGRGGGGGGAGDGGGAEAPAGYTSLASDRSDRMWLFVSAKLAAGEWVDSCRFGWQSPPPQRSNSLVSSR